MGTHSFSYGRERLVNGHHRRPVLHTPSDVGSDLDKGGIRREHWAQHNDLSVRISGHTDGVCVLARSVISPARQYARNKVSELCGDLTGVDKAICPLASA